MNGRAICRTTWRRWTIALRCWTRQGMVDLVTDNKSLFNAQDEINKQYKEGSMGRFAGFDFYENTITADAYSRDGRWNCL